MTSESPTPPASETPSVSDELLRMIRAVNDRIPLPPVRRLWLPEPRVTPGKGDEFGAVILDDGSVGLFFVLLGDTLDRLRDPGTAPTVAGADPAALAQGFAASDSVTRALGLGAINAVSQHVLRASGFAVDTETNSIASFSPGPDDHMGMVGFFPPLVRRLVEQGVHLTVIERKEHLVREAERFRVTLDPVALEECNLILCTSTVLLNDSLDAILAHSRHAEQLAVIGPTAGFLPDPLFARGVHTVGGHQVTDAEDFVARCTAGEKWGGSSHKYVIHRDAYPGYEALLDAIRP